MNDETDGVSRSRVPDSAELLRLIVDSATDFAIFAMDPSGLVTSWNTGAERVLGYREEEIVGRSADVIFPPEEGGPQAGAEERRRALAQGRAEDERWQMRNDGSRFWASGLLMPLADRSLGFVKILRDRTEQHRAEERLRENEERFRLLATNIPQLVFRCKTTGARTWGSPQWVKFTGLSLEESLEFGWLDAIHPDDREPTVAAWREADRSGEYYVEHRVRREADGEYRWHQTRARALDFGHGEWVGTMTDVHDLRGLQDRQQVLLAELQHRTRNLIALVQSIASQTIRMSASFEAFRAEFEDRLRALSRVQGLLASADYHDIELRDLLDAEITAFRASGADPEKVRIEGPSVPLPPNSAQALGLALHELATNAVKHGALSQPTGKLQVLWRVEPDETHRQLLLDWIESGVTLPEDGRPKRKGYGSELIERALPYELGAETRLEIGPQGVRCGIKMRLDGNAGEAQNG